MYDWSDARVSMLTTMWADGYSASQIAGELAGGISRSAVLGKVHRMGLAARNKIQFAVKVGRRPRSSLETRAIAAAERAVKKRPTISLTPKEPTPVPEPVVYTTEHMMTLVQLGNENCRYALFSGHEPFDAQFFCGTPTANVHEGKPYCDAHSAICFAKSC